MPSQTNSVTAFLQVLYKKIISYRSRGHTHTQMIAVCGRARAIGRAYVNADTQRVYYDDKPTYILQ